MMKMTVASICGAVWGQVPRHLAFTRMMIASASICGAVWGCILLWKGITGDVRMSRLGEAIYPRWIYFVGGALLIAQLIAMIIFIP